MISLFSFSSSFKYISCYCLSVSRLNPVLFFRIQIHLMLLFIYLMCRCTISGISFKYISCYCLSGFSKTRPQTVQIQIHLMLLFISHTHNIVILPPIFKYISCYCLSLPSHGQYITQANSNTSHVIVYQVGVMRESSQVGDSNTSHVIVYHTPESGNR